MTTNRDRLDEAIDIVATRMTNVEKDAALAARIAHSLPKRRVGLGGVLPGWAPRLAILALAALAITVVLRSFYDRSANVLPTESASAVVEPGPIVEPPSNDRRTVVEPPFVRRTTVEPSSSDRRTVSDGDHEFSLAPIDAPDALSLAALTPTDLAPEPVQEIAPLVLADLPLSSDFSPR